MMGLARATLRSELEIGILGTDLLHISALVGDLWPILGQLGASGDLLEPFSEGYTHVVAFGQTIELFVRLFTFCLGGLNMV